MVLDFDSLYNEAQSEAFAAGKRRFYNDRVHNVTSSINNGKYTIHAKVNGIKEHTCKITFDELGGVYDYHCDCDEFAFESGPCKHIVATVLTYEERNPNMNAQNSALRKTDAGALSLVAEYNRRHRRSLITGDSQKTDIIPHFEINGGQYFLRFTLGIKKQYTLKDITDFVSCVNSCSHRRYGVDLEFYHIRDNFTDNANKIIDFIMKCYLEKSELGCALGYKDELRLLRSDIDEFFAMNEGKLVFFGKNDLVQVVSFERQPTINLIVNNVEGGFDITLSEMDIRFIEGKDYVYVQIGDRMFRHTHEFFNEVKPFYDTLIIRGKLFISDADMGAFYNSVCMRLAKFLEISSDVNLSVYEASPFTCKIYINNSENGVSIDINASYADKQFDLFSDRAIKGVVRDWDTENELRGVLAKYFPDYPILTLKTDDEIYEFLSVGVKDLFHYAEVFVTESMKKISIRKPPRIHVGVRLDGELLNLNFEAEGYTNEELMAIITANRENKRYVRLGGGGFVSLDDSSTMALGDILDVAKVTDDGFVVPRYYAPYVRNELDLGFFEITQDRAFSDLLKTIENTDVDKIVVPAEVDTIMRSYQRSGFKWLKTLKETGFGGILADDMGLGKTLQILALLLEEKCKTLIVCPTTLMLNWRSEIRKFAPRLNVLTVMGGQAERKNIINNLVGKEYDIVITSYDLIRRDYEYYEKYQFDFLIADEAQFIKNPETKNAMSVKKLKAKHRFALTGTPVENNLSELWSIFDFLMPGYLGSYHSFRERYELDVVRGNEYTSKKLQRIVKPFILRRLKADVLTELPAKTESIIESPLDAEQKDMYEKHLAIVRDTLNNTPDLSKVVVLSMITRLRQICCHPSLVQPDYVGNSAKMDACLDLIQRAIDGGHRILLFSQFTSMLDIIRGKLIENGITHFLLKGDTPKAERLKLVNKFNESDTKVFLISLKAGGTGINLTGADVVIHYDPWWNESVMNQATDRAYRLGQTRSVQVYKLVMKDSIEEKIMLLQEKKSALSTSVVGKTNSFDEIIELLSN